MAKVQEKRKKENPNKNQKNSSLIIESGVPWKRTLNSYHATLSRWYSLCVYMDVMPNKVLACVVKPYGLLVIEQGARKFVDQYATLQEAVDAFELLATPGLRAVVEDLLTDADIWLPLGEPAPAVETVMRAVVHVPDRSYDDLPMRTRFRIRAFDESKSLTQWSRDSRCVVSYQTLRYRIESGMLPEEALTTPTHYKKVPHIAFGEQKTIKEWAADPRCVVGLATLTHRMWKGISLEEAMITPPKLSGRRRSVDHPY